MRREAGEAGETGGVALADLGEAIVGECGQIGGGIGIEHLDAGRGQRQQVHVDAEPVHFLQAAVLDIQQAVEEAHLRIAFVGRLGIVDAADQQLVEAETRAAHHILQRFRHLRNREGFLGRDLPDFTGG